MLTNTDHFLDPDPWELHAGTLAGKSGPSQWNAANVESVEQLGSTASSDGLQVSQALMQISQALSVIASEMSSASTL